MFLKHRLAVQVILQGRVLAIFIFLIYNNSMLVLIIGIVLVAFCVVAILPCGLHWGYEVLLCIKGLSPLVALFLGFIAIQMGISDIKDKIEAKKEAKEEQDNK